MSSGKIAQVIGPVVDVMFAAGEKLPEINNALVVYKNDERKTKIVLEVALELGDGMIRTIAMESTAVSYTHLNSVFLFSENKER